LTKEIPEPSLEQSPTERNDCAAAAIAIFLSNKTRPFSRAGRFLFAGRHLRRQPFQSGQLRLSAISHFYSPLPLTLRVPGAGAGGIFISDLTGDGSGDGSGSYPLGDVLTGTNVGSFGRSIKTGDLNSAISAYNQSQAGQPTPAGQALIQNGLLTLAQLQALGGVQHQIALAPTDEAGLAWLRALDLKFSWAKTIREGIVIEPSVSFFNLLNFANFDPSRNTLSGVLTGTVGSVNGTTVAARNTGLTNNRVTLGSGTFGFGAPRVTEFGLRLSF
jgi:hypothetical protein